MLQSFTIMLQNNPNMPQNFGTNAYHVALHLSKEMRLIFEHLQCFHDRFYSRACTASWP